MMQFIGVWTGSRNLVKPSTMRAVWKIDEKCDDDEECVCDTCGDSYVVLKLFNVTNGPDMTTDLGEMSTIKFRRDMPIDTVVSNWESSAYKMDQPEHLEFMLNDRLCKELLYYSTLSDNAVFDWVGPV